MKMRKRVLSFILCGAMIVSLCPQIILADEPAEAAGYEAGLCEHHPQHTEECGYTEGTEGEPCTHEHTEDCYRLVTECVHEHDASCYPEADVDDASPSEANRSEPTECSHECTEESGCITEVLDCKHEHGEACGYVPATDGTPCTYVCEICNPQDSGETEETESEDKCICTELCNGEDVNADCPVCGAEDADLTACTGTEPKTSIKSIAADLRTTTVATVTIGNTTTEYTDVESAFKAADGNTATIRLLQDAELSGDVTINSGDITYEGANHTLSSFFWGIVIYVGRLDLKSGNIDSALNISSGTLEVSGATVERLGYYGGTVNMSAGAINSIQAGNPSINYMANGITLDKGTLSLSPGRLAILDAKVSQNSISVNGSNVSIPVTWSSSDEAIATVDNDGKVTAVNLGSATITASAGGKSATCTVSVIEPFDAPTSLSLSGTTGSPNTLVASWNEVSGAENYIVQLYKGDESYGGAVSVETMGVGKCSHIFDITEAGTYSFTVKATGEGIDGKVSGNSNPLTLYTVTFESNGGSEVGPQYVEASANIREPNAPTKDGYSFAGWYRNENFTGDTWNFDSDTMSNYDMTLYAKWLSQDTNVTSVTVNGQPATAGEDHTFSVTRPYGTKITSDTISVITADEKAKVSNLQADENDNSKWIFTVTAEDGQTAENYTINVTFTSVDSKLTVKPLSDILTYGDELKIKVTPDIVLKSAANGINALTTAQNTVELYNGDKLLASSDAADTDGSYTLNYDTRQKGLGAGPNTLTVSYGGDGGLNPSTAQVTVTLETADVAARLEGPTSKTYDGTADAPEGLSIKPDGIYEGDDVSAEGTIVYDSKDVGTGKTITADGIVLTGRDAGYYHQISDSASVDTGSITAADLSGSLTITGTARYGQTLTANYTPKDDETVTYQWSRNGEPITGATVQTYTLTEEDVGKTITVTAIAADSNHLGSVTGDPVTVEPKSQSSSSSGSSSSGGSYTGPVGVYYADGRNDLIPSDATQGTWEQETAADGSVAWRFKLADGSYVVNKWIKALWNDRYLWYHTDMNGYLQGGRFTDIDGNVYYLHPFHDGNFGYMYTGDHVIDGIAYSFSRGREQDGLPEGALKK